MKRAAMLAGLAVCLTAGCTDLGGNPQALSIRYNTLVSSQTQCQVRAGATQMRSWGVMDIGIANSYWFFPQILNQLPLSSTVTGLSSEQQRLEANDVQIVGAEIHYDGGQLGDALDPVFVPASGVVAPQETWPAVLPIIPPERGNVLRANAMAASGGEFGDYCYEGEVIIAKIRIIGLLTDNTEIRSNEFWFPITVCYGCLAYRPPGADCTRLEEQLRNIPCFPGQDDGVDCRLCYSVATAMDGFAEQSCLCATQ